MALLNSPTYADPAVARTSVPVVEVREVRKTYQLGETEVHALRGVSVSIEAGDFVAIMGASGSGKSTFMNILGCLDGPTSGQYLLEGTDVSGLTKKQLARIRNQKIGFVFQGFNLLGRTTALENTELPMLYSRVSKKDRESRARETLALVGLADRAEHFPSQLSGGQQQRVAIARALTNRPLLLLADEPTGNLDSRTSVEVMELFQRLNADGLTIILVTHEPDIAQFAKREIVFRDGQIRRDEIVSNPAGRERSTEDHAHDQGLTFCYGVLGRIPACSARAGTQQNAFQPDHAWHDHRGGSCHRGNWYRSGRGRQGARAVSRSRLQHADGRFWFRESWRTAHRSRSNQDAGHRRCQGDCPRVSIRFCGRIGHRDWTTDRVRESELGHADQRHRATVF